MTLTFPSASLIHTPWCSVAGPHQGGLNTIPQASAFPLASFADGFVAESMLPVTSPSYIGVDGQDFNGIFNQITTLLQWIGAGGQFGFYAPLLGAIGGYPEGAVLQLSDHFTWVISTIDGNTSNPNSDMTGWETLTSSSYKLGVIVELTAGGFVKNTVDNNPNNPNISMTGWVAVEGVYQSTTSTMSHTFSSSGMWGNNITFTPTTSGRVLIEITGIVSGLSNGPSNTHVYTGTLPVPTPAGHALTGTDHGTTIFSLTFVDGNANTYFLIFSIVLDLSVGTEYWIDLAEAAAGATSGSVITSITELQ